MKCKSPFTQTHKKLNKGLYDYLKPRPQPETNFKHGNALIPSHALGR